MLAFTLHLLAMPIAIGSRLVWLMLAGMIIRPGPPLPSPAIRAGSPLRHMGHFSVITPAGRNARETFAWPLRIQPR